MKTFNIVCTKRNDTGKNAVRRIRMRGAIPVNLVSEGKSDMLETDENQFTKLMNAGLKKSTLCTLEIDGKDTGEKILVKEVQRHPVSGRVLHLDLYRIVPGNKVLLQIPVVLKGLAPGVKAGGALEHYIRQLKVRTLPEKIEEVIAVDISKLDVGQAIRLKDVAIPEEWNVLTGGDPIICKVAQSRATIQADLAAQAAAATVGK